jgi:hypothetical protein
MEYKATEISILKPYNLEPWNRSVWVRVAHLYWRANPNPKFKRKYGTISHFVGFR